MLFVSGVDDTVFGRVRQEELHEQPHQNNANTHKHTHTPVLDTQKGVEYFSTMILVLVFCTLKYTESVPTCLPDVLRAKCTRHTYVRTVFQLIE